MSASTAPPATVPVSNPPSVDDLPVTGTTKDWLRRQAPAPVEDKPRKIAIVGYTHSNRDAPYDEPGWQIWGLNNLHLWVGNTRWDAWFDIHDGDTIAEDDKHLEWLAAPHDFPIYTLSQDDGWPAAQPFPAGELKDRFGTYFTNSISWMVAYAITQVEWAVGDGAEIGIYGVDMAVGGGGGEYGFQRPSCEYVIGVARGMGITVTIPAASDLLKCANVYGEPENPLRAKLADRRAEMAERRGAAQRELDAARAHARQMESVLDQISGADETAAYIEGAWFTPRQDGSQGRAANDVRSGAPLQ